MKAISMSVGSPEMVSVLGLGFHRIDFEETLLEVERSVESGGPHHYVTPNLDFAVLAKRDLELQRLLLEAHRVVCDGMPLVWSSHLAGSPLPERVAGSDLVWGIAELSAFRGYRVFFYGSTETVLLDAKRILEAEYPGLRVVGHLSPPHCDLMSMDDEPLYNAIGETRPDILMVALGTPKQEKWIRLNLRRLGVPCVIGIGAGLDFVAGKTHRAPRWAQKCGLEWFFRLIQEPRRLTRRYGGDFLFLVRHLPVELGLYTRNRFEGWLGRPRRPINGLEAGQILASRRSVPFGAGAWLKLYGLERHFAPPQATVVKVDRRAETLFLGVVGEVSTPILEGTPELLTRPWLGAESVKLCELDLSELSFVDHAGLLHFFKLREEVNRRGGRLIVRGVSQALKECLAIAGVSELLKP